MNLSSEFASRKFFSKTLENLLMSTTADAWEASGSYSRRCLIFMIQIGAFRMARSADEHTPVLSIVCQVNTWPDSVGQRWILAHCVFDSILSEPLLARSSQTRRANVELFSASCLTCVHIWSPKIWINGKGTLSYFILLSLEEMMSFAQRNFLKEFGNIRQPDSLWRTHRRSKLLTASQKPVDSTLSTAS